MKKTCFVIMGYGIKNNINLDLTYNKIIKPCILENDLIPFPLYAESQYNAYRCDEISGTTAIDYKLVACLKGADIVIADISVMNINAIYELGARHALKPRSTILMCTKDKEKEFKFFDLTYVPIIFYDHDGDSINSRAIDAAKFELNGGIDFAINSATLLPDNPIQRALVESTVYKNICPPDESIYQLYSRGKQELDSNEFDKSEETFNELYLINQTEENLLLWALSKYKRAEFEKSRKGLIESANLITKNLNVSNSTSETVFGRLAAIYLRIYNLFEDKEYYYLALENYRLGATYSKKNLYCPRNYCALLSRIYEITDDINIICEYYYTAKHYAKLFLNLETKILHSGNYDDQIYYHYNVNDLKSILMDDYQDFEKKCSNLEKDIDLTVRQKETILNGIIRLRKDIKTMSNIVKPFLD